jgi:hypothetical protein
VYFSIEDPHDTAPLFSAIESLLSGAFKGRGPIKVSSRGYCFEDDIGTLEFVPAKGPTLTIELQSPDIVALEAALAALKQDRKTQEEAAFGLPQKE